MHVRKLCLLSLCTAFATFHVPPPATEAGQQQEQPDALLLLDAVAWRGEARPRSVVKGEAQGGVPDSTGWAHCGLCGYGGEGRDVELYGSSIEGRVLLSSSQWSEFFHHDRADEIWGVSASPAVDVPLLLVSRPVFLLPLLTLHPGHVYVDLLEQVWGGMQRHYGGVRRDALLVLDVAWPLERQVLQAKIDFLAANSTYALVLQALSALPVLSRANFDALVRRSVAAAAAAADGARVVFASLHLGMDNSLSSAALGQRYRPCLVPTDSKEGRQYRAMQAWLLGALGVYAVRKEEDLDTHEPLQLLIVQRAQTRRLLGVEALLPSLPYRTTVTDLALPLPDQLQMLRAADMLACVAGTAAHNVLFLRPGSGLLLLMQPGWCAQAFAYTAQARLAGVLVEVVCSRSDVEGVGVEAHWARRFWQQGPGTYKDVPVAWDEFATAALHRLAERVRRARAGLVATDEEGDECETLPGLESWEPSAPTTPALQVFVTSVSATLANEEYTVSLQGALATKLPRSLLAAFPSLCVCVRVLPSSSSFGTGAEPLPSSPDQACTPLSSMNYLSHVLLTVPVNTPVLVLHLWAAASARGGRIAGSETLHSIDLRVVAGQAEGGEAWGGIGLGDAEAFAAMRERSEDVALEVPAFAGQQQQQQQSHDGSSSSLPADAALLISFRAPASTARALQASFVPWCRNHDPPLPLLLCGDLHLELTRRLRLARLAERLGLPRPQALPSPSAPLAFLHVEKTGGSSMRRYLAHAAARLQLDSLVPCHAGMHCLETLRGLRGLRGEAEARLRNASVLAGHYPWGVWRDLPSWAARGGEGHAEAHPPCLVLTRHPVDRAISYYYQRCYQISDCPGFGRPLSSLSAQELSALVLYDRQGTEAPEARGGAGSVTVLDEGMSEAHCRALADERQTTGVDREALQALGNDFSQPLTEAGRTRALSRAGLCLVGSIDRWEETREVIRLWLPWIGPSLDALGNVHEMRLFSDKETRSTLAALRPDLVAVIDGANACDLALHDAMLAAFERQVGVLRDAAYL